jgi:hypothetical protein
MHNYFALKKRTFHIAVNSTNHRLLLLYNIANDGGCLSLWRQHDCLFIIIALLGQKRLKLCLCGIHCVGFTFMNAWKIRSCKLGKCRYFFYLYTLMVWDCRHFSMNQKLKKIPLKYLRVDINCHDWFMECIFTILKLLFAGAEWLRGFPVPVAFSNVMRHNRAMKWFYSNACWCATVGYLKFWVALSIRRTFYAELNLKKH